MRINWGDALPVKSVCNVRDDGTYSPGYLCDYLAYVKKLRAEVRNLPFISEYIKIKYPNPEMSGVDHYLILTEMESVINTPGNNLDSMSVMLPVMSPIYAALRKGLKPGPFSDKEPEDFSGGDILFIDGSFENIRLPNRLLTFEDYLSYGTIDWINVIGYQSNV